MILQRRDFMPRRKKVMFEGMDTTQADAPPVETPPDATPVEVPVEEPVPSVEDVPEVLPLVWNGEMNGRVPANPEIRLRYPRLVVYASHSRNDHGTAYYDHRGGKMMLFPDGRKYPMGGLMPGEAIDGAL
jgi:hypothetical protein